MKVGIVRPGGIATPGYDHAAGSSQSRRDCPFLVVVTTIVCCCHNFFVVVVTAIVIVIVTTTITKINVPGRLQQAWVAGFQLTLLDVFVRK